MNNVLIIGTISVLFEVIIICYIIFIMSRIINENNKIKKENQEWKSRMEELFSQNVSDIIIENRTTLKAINVLLDEYNRQ